MGMKERYQQFLNNQEYAKSIHRAMRMFIGLLIVMFMFGLIHFMYFEPELWGDLEMFEIVIGSISISLIVTCKAFLCIAFGLLLLTPYSSSREIYAVGGLAVIAMLGFGYLTIYYGAQLFPTTIVLQVGGMHVLAVILNTVKNRLKCRTRCDNKLKYIKW